jgi:hypothetical protein
VENGFVASGRRNLAQPCDRLAVVGFGPALTPRAQPQTAGFYFARPRPVVDPVFEAGALELQPPAPAAAGIVRPNAARTFFEGPEGPYP